MVFVENQDHKKQQQMCRSILARPDPIIRVQMNEAMTARLGEKD